MCVRTYVCVCVCVCVESQEWTPTSVTEFSECGSGHRVKEKEGLVASAASSSRGAEKVDIHPILEELDQHRARSMDLSTKLEDACQRIGEMEIQVEEEIEKRVDLEQKLEQEKERFDEASEREKRVANEKQMVQFTLDSIMQDKKEKEKLLKELKDQVKDLQEERTKQEETHRQQIHEKEEELLRLTEIEEQWKVHKSEVTILDETHLGGGGWGEVKVASFRGIHVAVKSLYQSIRSGYYDQLFVREMNMASRIRHPNLVQFIGACMDEEKDEGMLILMELFPTSLRKELEKPDFKMSNEVCKFITLDIARALNYLHLMRPDPFIHRDISSANVLLEPVGGKRGWRAKVTDYGSVNLQKLAETTGPGNVSYASPEARGANAGQQSTKMDVFSFGVLVLEMCTGHFPDESKRKREIASLRDPFWVNTVVKCINESPEMRPTAAVLVKDLESSLS